MKHRLAIVLPSARGGGAERVLLNLVQRFNRTLFSLHLIIIENSGPYLDLVPPDVQFHALGYDRVGKAIMKLAIVLRRVKPNVVMSSIGHLQCLECCLSGALEPFSIGCQTKSQLKDATPCSVNP